MVLRRGDIADSFYCVLSGELAVVLEHDDGSETTIRLLGPGHFFGEIGLLQGSPRTASVRALTHARVYRVEADDFHDLLEHSPPFARFIDFLFMIALIGGAATSLGFSSPMIAACLAWLFGIESGDMLEIAVVVLCMFLFAFSVWLGLAKGIKRLSDINVLLAFGLLLFIAGVGLRAGGDIIETFLSAGPVLVLAGIVVTLTPILVGYFFGRKVLKIHPVLLFGGITGSMTSGASLSVVTKAADSGVPSLGYTGAYAFANVLLTVAGSIILFF